ncbi:MAG TPA: hypothetical protein VH436_20735 [Vicinamibacterales bacterium]|jgi:hypothetical protein
MGHDTPTDAASMTERLGVLTRVCQMRVLNCSVTGCLLETNCRIEIGAIASIRVVIEGRELVDDVQIVRCQLIAGSGSVYHIGAQFLWTSPPDSRSIRGALWQTHPSDHALAP